MLHAGQIYTFLACEVIDPRIISTARMYGAGSFMFGAVCLLFLGVLVTAKKRVIPPVAIMSLLMMTHPNLWINVDADCGGMLESTSMTWGVAIAGVFLWGLARIYLPRSVEAPPN